MIEQQITTEINTTYQYQVGGYLPVSAPTYVKRPADEELYKQLLDRNFCYIISPPQTGKSSLLLQTGKRLQAEGTLIAAVNLKTLSHPNITPQKWYREIMYRIASSFNLTNRFDALKWWNDRELLSPVQRLEIFIEKVLLKSLKNQQNLVILLDDIDSINNLNFCVKDFFALIFNCYSKRSTQRDYEGITFAMMGATIPSELIEHTKRNPLNIARKINLDRLELHESFPLAKGLAVKAFRPQKVLQAILAWTGGQPFLTQKLCWLVVEYGSFIGRNCELKEIEKLAKIRIIKNWEDWDKPEHLTAIRRGIFQNSCDSSRLLELYQQILQTSASEKLGETGGVAADSSPEKIELQKLGLVVKTSENKLIVANRIYESVFNIYWTEKELGNLAPYKASLTAWLASERQDKSQLLTGKSLQAALDWAANKKLSPEHYSFLHPDRDLPEKPAVVLPPISETITESNIVNPALLDTIPASRDEQKLYNHIVSCVQTESPVQVIERFRQLFIDGMGYPDPDIEATLYSIVSLKRSEQDFKYILHRCCYIPINRWQLNSQYKLAIANLVGLFKQTSPRFGMEFYIVKCLQRQLDLFTKSEEFLNLERLVKALEQGLEPHHKQNDTTLGELIFRYPYLYSYSLLSKESIAEEQQTIQRLKSQKQQQFESELSLYLNYLVAPGQTEIGIVNPAPNPTLLNDAELHLALREFTGKVNENRTYKEAAHLFLRQAKNTKSYQSFKVDLYEYLISAVEPEYGRRQFSGRLYKYIKNTLRENDSLKLNNLLLFKTCHELFNFLVVENQHHPSHYVFYDLVYNLGPSRTMGLMLKLVLLSGKAKPDLEKRFSILFNHYEGKGADEIMWFIKSLENLNVAFVVNFGKPDLSVVKRNLILN